MYFLLLFFGFLAGITTVLFGFGGGFVVVPVLYCYSVLLATHGGAWWATPPCTWPLPRPPA